MAQNYLKKLIVDAYAKASDETFLKTIEDRVDPIPSDIRLVLLTPIGIIFGDTIGTTNTTTIHDLIFENVNDSYTEQAVDSGVESSDLCFQLKNVRIALNSGKKVDVGRMTVFYDQIIGLTIENIYEQ